MGTPLSFEANFTGVKPSGTYMQIPECPVMGRIVSVEANPHKSEPGASVAAFEIEITEPEYAGARRRINMRIPDQTEKGQKVLPLWRTALESIGVSPAALDGGQNVGINSGTFVGKAGYFYHVPRTEGVEGSYDQISFLTPQAYSDRKRAATAAGATAARQPTATVTGPAVVNGAGAPQPIAAADLRSNLLT